LVDRNLIQFLIDYSKVLDWLRTSCVVSITTVAEKSKM